jgi:hypothetical protein
VARDGDDARSGACIRLAWHGDDAASRRLHRAAPQRLAWHGDDGASSGHAASLWGPWLARRRGDATSRDDAHSGDDDAAAGWRWVARPDRGRSSGTSSGWWRMAWRWHGPAVGGWCAAAGEW